MPNASTSTEEDGQMMSITDAIEAAARNDADGEYDDDEVPTVNVEGEVVYYGDDDQADAVADDAEGGPKRRFVGLANQGATCYMNSLLQTMFMTPELRHALYTWEHVPERDGPPDTCIPFQLQMLFANLQLGKLSAVGTRALTTSFGWTGSEAFQQHDVEELNRVLFDALELTFKKTDLSTLVSDLYAGKMVDQIECRDCNNARSHTDAYMDIPLFIRNASNVYEALDQFTEAECLDGDNKVTCDTCAKKTDHLKGMKIASLPYFLTLQLKRFDFDYQTLRRVKLNNEVRFPTYLDMTPWLVDEDASLELTTSSSSSGTHDDAEDDAQTDDSAKGNSSASAADGDENEADNAAELTDEEKKAAEEAEKEAKKARIAAEKAKWFEKKEGDNVYELFSVLIHSGSALGGHYYAYIKNLVDGNWYNFNDSSVTPMKEEDIAAAWGGPQTTTSSYGRNRSSNGYMLVYRRVDAERNVSSVSDDEVPQHIRDLMVKQQEELQRAQDEWKKSRDQIRLKVFQPDEEDFVPVLFDRTRSIKELEDHTYETLDLETKGVRREDFRLRNYSSYSKVRGETFEGREELSLEKMRFYAEKAIMAETKSPDESFEVYGENDMTIRLFLADPEKPLPEEPVHVVINRDAPLSQFKERVSDLTGWDADKVRVLELTNRVIIHSGDDKRIKADLRIFDGDKIYVEPYENEEDDSPLIESFTQSKNTIDIKFNKPGSTKYTEVITMDKKQKLSELKDAIAKAIDLKPEAFKVRRGMTTTQEFKKLEATLESLYLRNNSCVYVVEGTPMSGNEFRISFFVVQPTVEGDVATDSFDIPLCESMQISEIRALVANTLGVDAQRVRLREKYGKKVNKAYDVDLTLGDCISYLYDGREIAVEILEGESDPWQPGDTILYVQQWKPSTSQMEPKQELIVGSTESVDEVVARLAGLAGIEAENVMMLRPVANKQVLASKMAAQKWRACSKDGDARPFVNSIYVLKDGECVVFKDATEEQMSEEDIKKLDDPVAIQGGVIVHAGYSSSGPRTTYRRQEQSLKIKVWDAEEEAKKKADAEAAAAAEAGEDAGPSGTDAEGEGEGEGEAS